MALANFFDKAALGASQILTDFDRQSFEEILLSHHVVVAFDDYAARSAEGQAMLDLLVRLLARLYPILSIHNMDSREYVAPLTQIALAINPAIELDSQTDPTIAVVVGNSVFNGAVDTFYAGSDNWSLKLNRSKPVGSGNTANPIGAGGAACFAAANVFRTVFRDQLPFSKTDDDLHFSMLSLTVNPDTNGLTIPVMDIGEQVLVGLGAIGNGALWTMNALRQLTGNIIGIDGEDIELSNLQRYVMATQNDIGKSKAIVMDSIFSSHCLRFTPATTTWAGWLSERNDWSIESVAICVDNKYDRVLVQGALPKKIFNAWTQLEQLGVSRHINFIKCPCLGCIYPPIPRKSKSVLIAEALNMVAYEPLEIRPRLATSSPIDDHLAGLISVNMNVDKGFIDQYIGKPLDIFYSEFVCGGISLKLNPGGTSTLDRSMDVPTAFESAFAGILLASEIVLDAMGTGASIRQSAISSFNLIREVGPSAGWINRNEIKRSDCFCSDNVFQKVYKEKYDLQKM